MGTKRTLNCPVCRLRCGDLQGGGRFFEACRERPQCNTAGSVRATKKRHDFCEVESANERQQGKDQKHHERSLLSCDYVQDGIRLLELSKKAYFKRKRKLLNFVCSNSIWKDHTLTATFRQPFDLLVITNTTWQRKKAAGADSSDLRPIWLRR